MRLSWNEIRARAARFADDWADAAYEKGETQSFYNDFFEVFGVKRRKVASFEQPVKLLGTKRGFIDLFWKGVLLVEQKSAGLDLSRAKSQALDYFPGLRDAELPRFILVSDFQTFELFDLEEDSAVAFRLSDLPANIEQFGFILGVQKRSFKDQDPVNVEASEIMGRLHDSLEAAGYDGHDLERLLVRLVFCLFADDTGIFEPRGIFLDLIQLRTQEDGSDTGRTLIELFDVLNQLESKRQKTLDEDLAAFPYINGQLFAERLPTPAFDLKMRALLIEACEFNWGAVSPAIFGSLFQSVMNAKERRASGAHYTTEKNIMKVIQPLFLDDLRAELERLRIHRGTRRDAELRAFHDRLSKLTFFDPACGCGNFLVIAYRELRMLEIELLKLLNPKGQRVLDVKALSRIDVDQFYGIEISEFPALIAETALWMMDHILNNRLSLEFGEGFTRIPLKNSPHIHCADALEKDWAQVLSPSECSFVLGNPPFIGQSFQSAVQRQQMARLVGSGRGGSLDYVSGWFIKAGEYVRSSKAHIGFVATNSITQGEQVAQLWPILFQRHHLEIAFAHRTFAWGSDARGVAHVHVVILGLTPRSDEPQQKRLFSYSDLKGDPVESHHASLAPYLFDASRLGNRHLVVDDRRTPLSAPRPMRMGSKIVDGGHYIFNDEQRSEFLKLEPTAAPYMRPFIGSVEYINGRNRWILRLEGVSPQTLRSMPQALKRIAAVKRFRAGSKKAKTRALADLPTSFEVTTVPTSDFLCIPEVSSERREYVPIGFLQAPTIPSNLVQTLLNADLWEFAILTSRMHMSWLRNIGGRLKSDYRYSIGIVYNSFPWPIADENVKLRLRSLAQAILDARAAHAGATLADLYDPDSMPSPLRRAHQALDLAVDRLYRPAAFAEDRERVEHLFGLYEALVAPITAGLKPAGRKSLSKA
ncbi:class I SAM-dependent DNA methyltransferase [Bradyrhizobium sp. CCGB12]|uniref:class I SAM-dependent DNA methyltransferase n=1 Tax=Bradyrhizobium sp. CCGB12 TaxID=2949632 RepID=UPI0020B406AE|nr:DNA methyltransferase [Bradyrhizobium sp. CCGB12]MCP3393890.1 class I SAM-dependent DNA methyltransferase [Bradyrhizobium sp. CCGB12]